MLHAFDGTDKLEDGVEWARCDGMHEDGPHDPEDDSTSVGLRRQENDEKDEVHPSHHELKRHLIESFTYRNKIGDIRWLR